MLILTRNNYILKVRRADGTWHPAEVIHRRLISESGNLCDSPQGNDCTGPLDIKVENGNVTKPDQREAEQDPYEYYIHYENFNRRLDEWVRRDRIRPLDEDVGEVSYALIYNYYLCVPTNKRVPPFKSPI